MKLREIIEEKERKTLSKYAALSQNATRKTSEICDVRTSFIRDRDRIVHCKSFRRLINKTQVFISPEDDHYRTRLTHTLEVSQISRTIARALNLNEDLTEAISMGHDLGHTAFGHSGEYALNKICPLGFKHNRQSLRVVDVLEKNGIGLNLTDEVRDGILCHTGDKIPKTLEGQIVRIADRIAYINHDIDDALRAGILNEKDLPKDIIDVLGQKHAQRINTLVTAMIEASQDKDKISMLTEIETPMNKLRQFMFANVYLNKNGEDEKAQNIVTKLYNYFISNLELVPNITNDNNTEIIVCDYIASMTDRYATKKFNQLVELKKIM